MLVDHTTASAEVAKELAEACAEFGVGFVDAPVSGGQAGAENGQLTIMCGSRRRGVLRAGPAGDGGVRQGVRADGSGRVPGS